jgi:hypothetical protein
MRRLERLVHPLERKDLDQPVIGEPPLGPGESTSTSATLNGVNSFSKTAAVARIVTDSLARA